MLPNEDKVVISKSRLAFALFLLEYSDDSIDFDFWKERWGDYLSSGAHFGDCITEPQTCKKCLVENIYEEVDFILNHCSERCKRLDESVKKELGINKERKDRAAK